MNLPNHKTKIVCTIGPGCRSLVMMEAMIKAGMNVARLNFSHADFTEHNENILNLRKASLKLNRYVNIFIDLPGSKMRLGKLAKPLTVTPGQRLILTNAKVSEGDARIPVDFHRFSQSAIKGNIVYINDGFIQLLIEKVSKLDVHCKVLVGGTMSSHKGINLPNAKLNLNAITPKDYECIAFGLSHGVKTYGISFVESAEDVRKVREFAKRKGSNVYLVAKIERREAINNIDAILKEADGIMIARGDLGVEIPIEEVPIVQKKLIAKANALGKPVITATQMLESMTQNVRPTRAEANDVTNAILDGTDAIMLSGETAVGKYPIETITVMCQIAAYTESQRDSGLISNDETQHTREAVIQGDITIQDALSLNVVRSAQRLKAKLIITPTLSGNTARLISRFKPHCWVVAVSTLVESVRFLGLSYGVHSVLIDEQIRNNPVALLKHIQLRGLIKKGDTIIITERRLSNKPGDTDSLGIIKL